MARQRSFASLDPAPLIEARRRLLTRIDMSADPLPPKCHIWDGARVCGGSAVVGLKRPDSLKIVYACAKHVRLAERSLI